MTTKASVSCVVALAFIVSAVSCGLKETYNHTEILDDEDKYRLHWTVDDATQSIRFGIEVTTTGWVAMGLSPIDASSSIDMVTGNLNPFGEWHIQDRHENGSKMLFLDRRQDYNLKESSESNGKAYLEFTRKLATSDSNDTEIKADETLKVIYAYGEGNYWHNIGTSKRGSKCINFFTFPKGSYCNQSVIETTTSVRSTTKSSFLCRAFKMAELVNEERYIVKIEPIIEEKYKDLVHHIALFSCPDNFDDGAINKNTECYGEKAAKSIKTCAARSVVSLWAAGVKTFTFPDHVGYPIQGKRSTKYVLLETYFRASKTVDTDIVTGFRLYHEKNRKYKSDVLTTGYRISGSMVIPPKQSSWISTSYCTKGCTKKIKNKLAINGDEIKFFAWMPHAHPGVDAMWANLVRKDKIIREIVRRDKYNTSKESIQMMNPEVTIKAEDEILTYCRYNTTTREYALSVSKQYQGGPLESQAVCLSFFMFYPRINFSSCISEERRIYKEFSMKYAKPVYKAGFGITYDRNKPKVPSQYRNWTGVEWNNDMVKELKAAYACNGKYALKQVCMEASSNSYTDYDASKPKINANDIPCGKGAASNLVTKPTLIMAGPLLWRIIMYMSDK